MPTTRIDGFSSAADLLRALRAGAVSAVDLLGVDERPGTPRRLVAWPNGGRRAPRRAGRSRNAWPPLRRQAHPRSQPLLKPLACAIPITGRARIVRLYPIDFANERRR
jgi:hypothetical protein